MILALALTWAAVEGLARWRFDLQNPWLPMGLRRNLSTSSLQAHRLLPSRDLVSRRGVPFKTDALGFRTGGAPVGNPSLLLGGDSIAFGMYLPYEQSLGFYLDQTMPKWGVQVSALPGGSQAMSRDLLLGEDQLLKKSAARVLLHSVNHYDNNDNWLYHLDQVKNHGWRAAFRQGKTWLGPYAIQVFQLKLRQFLAKDRRRDLLLYADEGGQRHHFDWTREPLDALLKGTQDQGVMLALFFLPDRGEVGSAGWLHDAEVAAWAQEHGVPYFNLEMALEKAGVGTEIFMDDGIHLNPEGHRICARLLADWLEASVLP